MADTIEKTYFKVQTSFGFDIACVFKPCKNPENEKKNGTIIICHGILSGKEHPLINGIANGLIDTFSVCQIDFRGNGSSGGETTYGNYYDEVEDIREVVVHLRKMGKNVTTLLGHSKGNLKKKKTLILIIVIIIIIIIVFIIIKIIFKIIPIISKIIIVIILIIIYH